MRELSLLQCIIGIGGGFSFVRFLRLFAANGSPLCSLLLNFHFPSVPIREIRGQIPVLKFPLAFGVGGGY